MSDFLDLLKSKDGFSKVHPVHPLDISSMSYLYRNCLRMGEISNSNVETASISPSLWFEQIFESMHSNIKIVVDEPQFTIIFRKNNKTYSTMFICEPKRFDNDLSLVEFLERKFVHLAVFSICKFVDLSALKSYWEIKSCDIKSKEEIRDSKIDFFIETNQ